MGKRGSYNFDAIRISIASPEKIESWSSGEVKNTDTINYRTFKPEYNGLFCEKIFGPAKDFECHCGKYKGIKYRGITCDRCGVELTHSKVRRERMGHIALAAPVAHTWFLRNTPSVMGTLLDMTQREIMRILYFEAHVVLDGKTTPLKKGEILSEEQYREAREKYGDDFVADQGAEAIRKLLKSTDLKAFSQRLRKDMRETTSDFKKHHLARRLRIIESFLDSGNKPEWTVLKAIPVLPPDLRPLVPVGGGRFASSDLNDLYRIVINRNNRIKRLHDLKAPEIIIRNEKRMLQEAVDALFDNGRGRRAILGENKRPLKSLSDLLRGKQGRFRKNLLGKRVDYSGRSVIVVGPELRLHQCGLPKIMALELFKPFIYHGLLARGLAPTIKIAKKMIEGARSEVWDVLDEVIREHPVFLNRAPTLHRLGFQAFEPVLTEGKAIQLHPLVCTAFNADFDGDQMAVHVPLSVEAQAEARVLAMATNNLLSPADGKPIINPTQDIVLGIYYMTRERPYAKGEGKIFSSPEEVRIAYDANEVDLQARIRVRIDGELAETTTGRILLKEVLPEEIPFSLINQVMKKNELSALIDYSYRFCGGKKTVILSDQLKDLGFHYATLAGISISMESILIPSNKTALLEQAEQEVQKIQGQYREGLITEGERYNKVIDIWAQATENVAAEMFKELGSEEVVTPTGERTKIESFNPVYMMVDSGARGGVQQVRQLAGMRGLMAKPSGEIIETPITANFREGLTVLQYFVSTHGARKGLADTALKTANAGYLTRRLVDVAQDVVIAEYDCGTLDGIVISPLVVSGEVIEPLSERLLGRVSLEDVHDPFTEEVIVKKNEEIDKTLADRIEELGIEKVKIRSVLTCESKRGLCSLCYGRDLSRESIVEVGEAVGIIAAQSIGEPGTQLTMRTFHIGGTASRRAEQTKLESPIDGKVKFINLKAVKNREGLLIVMNRNGEIAILDEMGRERRRYAVIYGATLRVRDKERVKEGDLLAEWDPYSIPLLTEVSGRVEFGDIVEGMTMGEQVDEFTGFSRRVIIESRDPTLRPRISILDGKGKSINSSVPEIKRRYLLPVRANISVSEGDYVKAGDILAKIPREIMKTKDITGGLPRVIELFEGRKPKEYALISDIDGFVHFGGDFRGKRRITIRAEAGEPKEYLIPRGKHVNVSEGDFVRAGEPLMPGPSNPHDILRVLGDKALARYLVDEIQEIYKLQGAKINDKHIEVIVRQMLKRVKIKEAGDTHFWGDDVVEKQVFKEENERVLKEGGKPAVAESYFLGITKASLITESFISAASFQETTKVLTQAAAAGEVDRLKGLKENVIMGRLIPAGTGLPGYWNRRVWVEGQGDGAEEDIPTDKDGRGAAREAQAP